MQIIYFNESCNADYQLTAGTNLLNNKQNPAFPVFYNKQPLKINEIQKALQVIIYKGL